MQAPECTNKEMLSKHLMYYFIICYFVLMSPSQLLVLSSESLLRGFGYYRIILYTFYVEAALAAIMLALGPQHYYILAFFLTINM